MTFFAAGKKEEEEGRKMRKVFWRSSHEFPAAMQQTGNREEVEKRTFLPRQGTISVLIGGTEVCMKSSMKYFALVTHLVPEQE